MNEEHFIKGDLSTDYLDRFSIIDKMNDEIKNKFSDKTKILPGVAAVMLYSEFIKSSKINSGSSSPSSANAPRKNLNNTNTNNNWKYGGVAY
jgi:acetyl-CoA/propionyl-CoA carboxylase